MLEPSQTDVDDRLSVGAEFDSPVAGSSEAKVGRGIGGISTIRRALHTWVATSQA